MKDYFFNSGKKSLRCLQKPSMKGIATSKEWGKSKHNTSLSSFTALLSFQRIWDSGAWSEQASSVHTHARAEIGIISSRGGRQRTCTITALQEGGGWRTHDVWYHPAVKKTPWSQSSCSWTTRSSGKRHVHALLLILLLYVIQYAVVV